MRSRKKTEGKETARIQKLLHFEQILWGRGVHHVAGVDEVGLGAMAGPVVAAAVVMPPYFDVRYFPRVNDSKQLSRCDREMLAEKIRARALSVGIGSVDVDEIANLNIYRAGLEAMRRAVSNLTVEADHVLLDGRGKLNISTAQNSFIKGDAMDFSIAAASIVAKVHRDALMVELDAQFPQYGFKRHKGYGTKVHWSALRRYGPCPVHRGSYEKIKQLGLSWAGKFQETAELSV